MTYNLYPSILLLEDGIQYNGWSFSVLNNSIGEVVFNTGMTGYQEVMTDPSYLGQIVAFTYPELGNTGFNDEDYESKHIQVSGIIAKNICRHPSNWRKQVSLSHYLLQHNIPHIFGIDTRALSKYLRIRGVMKGGIFYNNLNFSVSSYIEQIKYAPSIKGLDLVSQATISSVYKINPSQSNFSLKSYSYLSYKTDNNLGKNLNVVVIDLGVKYNILSRLLNYGCNLYILPAMSTYFDILSYKPDGILLSNGPGDPSVVTYMIKTIRMLVNLTNIPIFGICMGHQLLSLALGGKTFKLKFGHRGLNHPSGTYKKVEITSQNHGFVVSSKSFSEDVCSITHFNLNDSTVAGIIHESKPLFSVQYHPEASPGPHDSEYLFMHFVQVMKDIKFQVVDQE